MNRGKERRSWLKFTVSVSLLLALLFMLGGCAWIREWLNPNKPPVAIIRANPTSGEAPLEVIFDASESYDPDGDEIVSYEWDFGNGTTAEGQIVQRGFDSPGDYTVQLVVTDDKGAKAASSAVVTVFQPTETVVEHSFDAQTGTEFDTGTGLKVSVPPAPTEGQMKLVVRHDPTPPQPPEDFLALHSVYTISIIPEGGSQAQGQRLAPAGAPQEHLLVELVPLFESEETTNINLTFDLPKGSDPMRIFLFEWTEDGWSLASPESWLEQIYSLGGWLSPDKTKIHFETEISPATPQASSPVFGLGTIDYKGMPGLLEGPFVKSESEAVLEDGSIEKIIKFGSPSNSLIGGFWYKVELEASQGLQEWIWNPSWPDDTLLVIDPDGSYLAPGHSGTLILKFKESGGRVKVCFNAQKAFLLQFADWFSKEGISIAFIRERAQEISEATEDFWDELFAGELSAKEGLYKLAKIFWELLPETLGKAFWEFIKSPFGFFKVLIYLDFLINPPHGRYEFPIAVKVPSSSTLYPPNDLILSSTQAGKEQVIEFEYDVNIKDYNYWFVATITPGNDVYRRDFTPSVANPDPSGRYTGQLKFVAPAPGESQTFTIQGQMCPTPEGETNEDSETVTFTVTTLNPPDLTVTSLAAPNTAKPGDIISIGFTVENKGGPTSESFRNKVFLSTERYLGGQDIFLGEFPMSLDEKTSKTETVEVTIPQVLAGNWWLVVYVDGGQDVEESNENNNIDGVPITITASQPANVTLTLYVHEGTQNGPPIRGARVQGHDAAGNPFDKTTNSSGYVTITGAPGTWHFEVSKSGYYEKTWEWEITKSETRHAFLEPVQAENRPPVIESLVADPPTVQPGGQSRISVSAHDLEGDLLTYTWSTTGGRLSATTGPGDKIWTAPNTPGPYQVTVSVTDNKPGHSPVTRSVEITVVAQLTIITDSLPSGQVGKSYQANLEAAGGTPPYRWSIEAGSLPSGLSLVTETGEISGTPTTAGTFNFTVQVRDSAQRTAQRSFSMSVVSSVTKPQVMTDSAVNVTETSATLRGILESTGGETCEVWFEYGTSTSYGHSTERRSLTTAGPFSVQISGLSPNTTYHFRACAANSEGPSYGQDVTFRTKENIDQLPEIIRPQENEVFQAEVGKLFSFQVEARDPEGQKLVYVLTEWPSALTLDRDTGLIQWTPSADFAGRRIKVTFYVSDRPIGQTAGREVYRTFYINVQAKADTTPPTVVSTNPADGDLGAPVTDTITVTFSEEVRRGTGSVTVIDEARNNVPIQEILVSGRVLTIHLVTRLAYSTGYGVIIEAGAVVDLEGNPNSQYSWTFITQAPQAPPPPTLVSPPNGATDVSTTPTLRWNSVSGAEGYAVQVARDSGFSDMVFDQVVLGTSVQVNPPLGAGTRYFWRVASMGEDGSISSWSDIWSFTTQAPMLPDLVVEDIWTEPSPPIATEYTTIGIKIRNQGDQDITGTFYLELFFDGVSKGRASISGLAAGETKTSEWRAVQWPSDTNYHTIRTVVDPDNLVTESNETNNVRSEQFQAKEPHPQTGNLWVESNPGGAAVYVDGQYKGTTPPTGYLKIESLPAGDHTLKVTKEGYRDWIGTVTVPAGSTAYKTVILTKFLPGDVVEVFGTGGYGLSVRDKPCGTRKSVKPDGAQGVVIEGPKYCCFDKGCYNWWRIRWDDGLVGWSAEDYLRLAE